VASFSRRAEHLTCGHAHPGQNEAMTDFPRCASRSRRETAADAKPLRFLSVTQSLSHSVA
jgi:hypothetical protein